MVRAILPLLCLSSVASAHIVAWTKGMYCLGGRNASQDQPNTNEAANPLFNMTKEDWWFQHYQGCDAVPPKGGDFLNLPANGNFTVELAHNRGQTTLSFNGQFVSDWPDGGNHPANWSGTITANDTEGCIKEDGLMHTHNQSTAAGTAFAISYNANLTNVTMENLAVFTVLEHTPWKRLSTYQVPDLPACPPGGCHCAFLWVPTGCGTPNMYMAGYRCQVTNATSTRKVGPAKPPTYCRNNSTLCVKGPKQMIAWNQKNGTNVVVPYPQSPGYNSWNGFSNGAQTDIFI